jgi:hypothetical protein
LLCVFFIWLLPELKGFAETALPFTCTGQPGSVIDYVRKLTAEEKYPVALNCLETALKQHPENRDLHFYKARVLAFSGSFDEAHKIVEKHGNNDAESRELKDTILQYQASKKQNRENDRQLELMLKTGRIYYGNDREQAYAETGIKADCPTGYLGIAGSIHDESGARARETDRLLTIDSGRKWTGGYLGVTYQRSIDHTIFFRTAVTVHAEQTLIGPVYGILAARRAWYEGDTISDLVSTGAGIYLGRFRYSATVFLPRSHPDHRTWMMQAEFYGEVVTPMLYVLQGRTNTEDAWDSPESISRFSGAGLRVDIATGKHARVAGTHEIRLEDHHRYHRSELGVAWMF